VKIVDFGLVVRRRRNDYMSASFGDTTSYGSWIDDSTSLDANNGSSSGFTGTQNTGSSNSSSSTSIVFQQGRGNEILGGNYLYSSREIVLKDPVDHMADWWAVGVLLFHFISGTTPFYDDNKDKVLENIMEQKVNWESLPGDASEDCRYFIRDMLMKPLDKRLGSAKEIFGHEYFNSFDTKSLFSGPGPMTLLLKGSGDSSYFQKESSANSKTSTFAILSQEDRGDPIPSPDDEFVKFSINNF